MQSIEMMVFFIASIAIASLILIFIGGINPEGIYSTIEALVFQQPLDANTMVTVTKDNFAGKMGACWEQSSLGAKNLNCGTFYITDEGLADDEKILDSPYLEAIFEKYNYCTGCVVSVVPAQIELPAVVGLTSENGTLAVKT